MSESTGPPRSDREAGLLRGSVAFVWLWTGAMVLHPRYRELGGEYLRPLGLPDGAMIAACVAEIMLGLLVAFGRPWTWLTAAQAALILGFTAILSASDPALLLHPDGYLLKNLPLLAILATVWLAEREGW